MPRTRIEIQKDVNASRMSMKTYDLSLNDPSYLQKTGQTYFVVKNKRDDEALKLMNFEKELAEAKARGDKGRTLDEIHEEISKEQSNIIFYRSIENTAPIYTTQWNVAHDAVKLLSSSVIALQQELEETIKEQEQEEKAEIEKIKQGYEQEISSNPDNAEVYIRRGVDFFARGMVNGENQSYLNQAKEDFTQAVKIDPNAKDAYLNRAGLYSQIKDFNSAIADYNQVIRIDPDNAEAYAFRGSAYSQINNEDKAITDYDEAIRLNPKIKHAHTFRGLYYLAKAESEKGNADYDKAASDIDKAIADIEEELKIYPDNNAAADILKNVKTEKEVVAGMIRERQERYDWLVQEVNNAPTENEYQDIARQLRAMRGFKDTVELANKCDKRYQELKKEREAREAEEAARRAEEAAIREAKEKKNRQIGVLAAVIVVAALISFISYRQTRSFFQFQQNNQGTITITGYSGKKQIVIPTTQNGVNVTEIGNNAFSGKELTSVTIPDGITVIGAGAFSDNRLTNVTIPDSVKVIGNYAFFNNKLISITLGGGVTSIGDYSFSGNFYGGGNPTNDGNQLTDVIISDSVTVIGAGAFRDNRLTSVIIPDSVTTIDYDAFINNKLTSVVIGKNVVSIGGSAFEGNELSSIIIPNSVTSVGAGAFANNLITSVKIGANVTIIGKKWDSDGILGASTGFNTAYTNQKSRAGTYTRPNVNSTNWTRR